MRKILRNALSLNFINFLKLKCDLASVNVKGEAYKCLCKIKHEAMKITDIKEFGFYDWREMWISLVRPHDFTPILSISLVTGFCTQWFGLSFVILVLLAVIITLELITGVTAAKLKGEKIQSKKLHRFGFKLFIWFFFLLMFRQFQLEYKGTLSENVFSYLHSFAVFYIISIYTWSVLENIGKMGKDYREFSLFGKKIKKNLDSLRQDQPARKRNT